MEIFIQILVYFSIFGAVAFFAHSILQYVDRRADEKATDINNYEIIQKSNGKYYRTRNGKYEWQLYGDTLEQAKKSLEEHVEWEKGYYKEKYKPTGNVVWSGDKVKS